MKFDRRHLMSGGGAAAIAALSGSHGARAQPAATVSYAPAPAELAAMADAATEFMRNYDVPGLGVAIVRQGVLVYDEAFGMADREAGERLTPAHRFRVASVSKPITSVAMFTLIEQGRLGLDDRVFGHSGILGNDFGSLPAGSQIDQITVEHLLTHTSGGWTNDGNDPMFQQPQLDHRSLIAWTLANRPLTNQPGRVLEFRLLRAWTGHREGRTAALRDLRAGGSLDTSRCQRHGDRREHPRRPAPAGSALLRSGRRKSVHHERSQNGCARRLARATRCPGGVCKSRRWFLAIIDPEANDDPNNDHGLGGEFRLRQGLASQYAQQLVAQRKFTRNDQHHGADAQPILLGGADQYATP